MDQSTAFQMSIEAGKIFTPTAPIDEKSLFAGRKSQIRKVMDAVFQKGQHAVIFGERGVGKTSLSNVLADFLLSPGTTILSPRINCDAQDTFESLWLKIFNEIQLSQTVRQIGFEKSDSQTAISATALLQGDISPDGVRRALMALSQSALPVLIVDEFDRVPIGVRGAFADTIKTLSDHAVAATVVLVGVAESVDQLIDEHHSIERALVQIQMPRMSILEIQEIIDTGLQRLGMSIEESAKRRIVMLSQGLPHYTHLICLSAAREALDAVSDSIDINNIESAMNKAIEGAQQSIRSAYHTAIRSPRPDNLFADVLLACALAKTDELGMFAAQDVRKPMQAITGKNYEIPSFAQHLNEFSETKRGPVLVKTGTKRSFRYKFINPLMQPFVVMQGFATSKITKDTINALASTEAESPLFGG
jgi:Cdc6-like AAA superfamily ATPase